ncbi:anti-sigma factor family protein [Actinorugispora endophytica]|uniref:Putative zinc finger protein n=1 Tax=Actinorugispora endophytica TaxID=1605990 RepID=A0A4R6VCQ0_9ACTN|nr:zf-HC2 domain-containing protein [Actinorugispora endophytica]TDQ54747.1 putative zinc finger protein [Actinorugispora endophytica]
MSHLGERLSAFVDGELGHGDRDRVLSHLAKCEACRFEAEMLRTLKRRLHALGAPEPGSDFLGRLSALSGTGRAAPPDDVPPGPPGRSPGFFGSSPPLGSSRPIGGGLPQVSGGAAVRTPVDPGPPARAVAPVPERIGARFRSNWGRARYAVAGASVVAVALSAAFVAGEEPSDVPVVAPALADFAVEHAVVSGQAPLPGPAAIPVPALVPAQGGTVNAVDPTDGDPDLSGAVRTR